MIKVIHEDVLAAGVEVAIDAVGDVAPKKTTRTAAYVAVARKVSDERDATNAAMEKPKTSTEMEVVSSFASRVSLYAMMVVGTIRNAPPVMATMPLPSILTASDVCSGMAPV